MSQPARKKRHDMPDPHKVQREASDPASSVWVGASAGSGKTTVLVSRVLRLLLAGVEPQKILCLTFTKAAAAEMANRVTKALSHWAVCSEDELRESLDKLQSPQKPTPKQLAEARRLFAHTLSCPGGMRIRTIHAFCQEILRRFPIEAGLPPHFKVIEEIEARALRDDVQNEVLQAASGEPDGNTGKALHLLVRDLGERGFEEAMNAIMGDRARLATSLAEAGGLKKLVAGTRALFDLAPGDSEDKFRRDAVDDRRLPRADMLHAGRLLIQGGKKNTARGHAMLDWLALPVEERMAAFEIWCRCFFTAKGDLLESYADKKLLDQHPDLDILLRREAARLQSVIERCDAARMAESTAAVLTLGAELMRRFETRKRTQALLDYDDLVIRAGALLHRQGIAPWVLYKLDGGLDHILVDEAQDTSRAQWGIVTALAEEFFAGLGARPDENRTLFVVGDEKQSIFSFQHADPAAFAEMRELFQHRIEDAEKPFREVPLHMSFRSAPAILKAVDAIFSSEAARRGVSSEPVEHYPAKEGLIGRVEVLPLIPAPEKDSHPDEWVLPLGYEPERDPQAELATQIATRIAKWLASKEKLPGYAQPIAPGDIMILLRRRGRFADLMVRALKKAEVPVTGVDRMQLVKQLAVMDLLALMQFALLPEDDLNLASVLRGPLLGISEDQLMELAIPRKSTLWQSLKDNPAFAAARDYLQGWLAEADLATPFMMLAHMLNEACPGNAVSGRQALWGRLGPDALDPVDELLNAAQQFGPNHTPSLQAFLHWLTATEAEIKRELDQGGGQVRIMTVHAAKGLEAPIVFLPDAANMSRASDVPKLLWNDAGMPLYLARKPQSGTARRLWEDARQKQMEEYRRLFYVALTRAANRLYIGGWATARNEGDNAAESWYALARTALLPLHEPMNLGEDNPDIAFADIEIGSRDSQQRSPPLSSAVALAKADEGGVRGGVVATRTKSKDSGRMAHALTVKLSDTLPTWARQPAPAERAAPKPLAPSKLAAESEPPVASPDILYARGRIIHRLLQSLPDVEDKKRDAAAARFLANPQHRLPKSAQEEIKSEVLRLLRNPDYAPLFASGSRAEVPLTGYVGDQQVSGQIDRLCVRENDVWIIDYKSNRPPPATIEAASPAYIKQLAAYRAVLQEIYPGKPIHCFLLWTYNPTLMPVPDKILDAA